MAIRKFTVPSFTPVAVADTANFTDAGYMAIQGGNSTQRTFIKQVLIEGLAVAGSPTPLVLALDSTVGGTLSALAAPNSDGPAVHAAQAVAAPPVPFVASTTKPQRSALTTLRKLALGLNAYGGQVRWESASVPGSDFEIFGNAVNAGEASLSCVTGGTAGMVAASILYEPL